MNIVREKSQILVSRNIPFTSSNSFSVNPVGKVNQLLNSLSSLANAIYKQYHKIIQTLPLKDRRIYTHPGLSCAPLHSQI